MPVTTLLLLSLTACAGTEPRLILPPVSLTECAAAPIAPELPGRDQQDERDRLTGEYILGWVRAHGDCKAKVNGLKTWRETAGE